MGVYKLSDGTSSVDMSPTRGLNIPETRIREHIETKEGPTDTHEWGNAEKYEVPLINLTKARADQLLTWWQDMEVLTFTPDPGSPIQMIIDGIERPLNMWAQLFDTKYAGMLRLCEVSSQSFSESEISVSGSTSCSVFDASESCSTFSSLSCSAFNTFCSRSSSVGLDCDDSILIEDVSCSTKSSYSGSGSTSGSESCSVSRSCSFWSSYVSGGYSFFSSCEELSSCSESDSTSISRSESNSTSCSDSYSISCSTSTGVIEVCFTSKSCSLDPSETSCSESVASKSCSLSAGGIS